MPGTPGEGAQVGRILTLSQESVMPSKALRVDRMPEHDLARRVRNFLHKQSAAVRELDIEVAHDVVTVRGRVPTEYVRHLATHCCQRVAGVRSVVNEVEVHSHPR
jgi:osmotically-inducible protein OsmY